MAPNSSVPELLQFCFSSFCKGALETFATSWQSDWAASWEAKACKTSRWEEKNRCSVSRCKNIQVGACKQSPANSFNISFLDHVLSRWGGETASWTFRSQWTSPTAPASTPLFFSPRFQIEKKVLIKSWQNDHCPPFPDDIWYSEHVSGRTLLLILFVRNSKIKRQRWSIEGRIFHEKILFNLNSLFF